MQTQQKDNQKLTTEFHKSDMKQIGFLSLFNKTDPRTGIWVYSGTNPRKARTVLKSERNWSEAKQKEAGRETNALYFAIC